MRVGEQYPRLTRCSVRYEKRKTLHDPPKLLDVIALLDDVPDHRLRRGQVGTIVEELASDVFEVECSDEQGRTYALLALRSNQLMVFHDQPALVT